MIKYTEIAEDLYELDEDYNENGLEIKAGFQWDGASIPWWLRWLFKKTEKTKEASMVHDYIYRGLTDVSRSAGDFLFRKLLLEDGVLQKKAKWMYRAVRLVGFIYYRGNINGRERL